MSLYKSYPQALVMAVVFSATGLTGCRHNTEPQTANSATSTPHNCARLHDQAEAVWNLNTRTELDIPVRIFDGQLAAADAEHVVSQLDRFTVDWILLSETVCKQRASNQGETSRDYRTVMGCLNAVLNKQEDIIRELKNGDSSALPQIDTLHPNLVQCYPELYATIRKNPFTDSQSK